MSKKKVKQIGRSATFLNHKKSTFGFPDSFIQLRYNTDFLHKIVDRRFCVANFKWPKFKSRRQTDADFTVLKLFSQAKQNH